MSEPWMDLSAAARPVSLTELFALERSDFAPMAMGDGLRMGLSSDGFRPGFGLVDLSPPEPEVIEEEPAIDMIALREAEFRAELETARTQAFAAGLEAGRGENEEAVRQIVEECRALMKSLDEARIIDKAALGPMLKRAVLELAGQVVEAHVKAEPTFVNSCINRALSTMKDAHEAARLYLNPDDLALMGSDVTEGYRNLTIVADPALPLGTVRLEAGGGEVEDGVRPRLVRLEQALRAAGLAA